MTRKRILVALGFALLAMACGYMYLNAAGLEAAGGKKVAILVAAGEVQAGARLTRNDLATREIPEAFVHPDAIPAGEAEARLVGRPVMTKLAQGQPILWSTFDAEHAAPQRLAVSVPKHKRAITLPVDLSGGFAGLLRPGDHVDVLGTFQRSQNSQGDSTTVTILQDLVVLATGSERGEGDPNAGRGFNSVTLAVDLNQAELLLFAQQRGTLGFALRSEGDFETVTDIGEKSFTDVLDQQRRLNEYKRGQKPDSLTAARPGVR